MPEEAKPVVKTIATWAAIATVVGILLQAGFYTFVAGRTVERKADRVELQDTRQEWATELKEHERRFTDHIEKQAHVEGQLLGELRGIHQQLTDIKNRLE